MPEVRIIVKYRLDIKKYSKLFENMIKL